ncbi:MAG: exonuclease SbcCD subunit D [Tenericutes bacterium]|nr:exonuclease SbcCD subunit D [Mycoplasmatota bacterium]
MKNISLQILHCSDTHLDKSFGISNLSKAIQRREDLNHNFSSIVDYALKNKPDIFLIAGDVFDKILPTNASRVFLTSKIKLLNDANIEVFIIGGNHDIPRFGSSPSLAIDVLGSAGIATVFSRSDIIQKKTIKVHGKSVCVSGRSYYTKFERSNPLEDISVPIEGDYNILMIHGSLQGLNVASSVPEFSCQNPFRAEDITKGLNYLALGHFHNYFEREYKGCTIVNPGSIEKLSWAEMNDDKGFVWAELNGQETTTEFIELETRPMETSQLGLSKTGHYIKGIKNYVLDFLTKLSNPEKILKINLNGLISQDQYNQLKINELLRACNDLFFNLRIDRRELEIEGYGRVFMERLDNPVEAYSKRLEILISNLKPDNPERQLLEKAKYLGIKYLESTR